MNRSGAQEVEWLKSQLTSKLRNNDLDASTRNDIQTLLTVLQCPVFGKIVTIEDSLNQLRKQLQNHPSLLPVDFDISPKSGELLINIPVDHAPGPEAISSGNQSDSSDHPSHNGVNRLPVDHISAYANQSNHVPDDREPPAYANTKCKPPVISPKPRPADQMVLTSDWVQVESIFLVNDVKGLGFGIVGGKSTGVIVKTLVCGGIADRDRRMKVGDHILAIGDVNLRGMSSEQVAHVLRTQTGPTVRMILARPIDPKSVTADDSSGCAIIPTRMLPDMTEVRKRLALAAAIQTPPEPLPVPPPGFEDEISSGDVVCPSSKELNPENIGSNAEFLNSGDEFSILLPPPAEFPVEEAETETFDVTLVKDRQGLGITIAGYVCEKVDISGIFVKSIAPGSAADKSNKIQIHDKIIEVDGNSLHGYTNHQAVEVLRQSGSRVHLKLARYLRGAKFDQLQQLVASSDVPSSVTPHPVDAPATGISSPSGSTLIQVEGNGQPGRIPSEQMHPESIGDPDYDLPPPPPPSHVPGIPQTTTVTVNGESDEHRKLREKWIQKLGPGFVVVVAQIQKFSLSGGLGISLEGTVDIEDGKETRSHHYIRAILPEGPVGVEGSLKPGDEILEVNGRELILMNHEDVVTLLKELPVSVQMVCGRSLPSAKFCANNNIVNIMNNNNNVSSGSDILCDQGKSKRTCAQSREGGGGGDGIHSLTDRLVKAKSDGSLAVGITSTFTGPALTLTDDSSRIRSRSLEPLTGLAMWSSDPLLIQLTKGERGLGFSILDYQDPMNPNETVIVVRSLVPGGVAQSDGRLIPGDRLISVNGINLENASLDEAVQALKGTGMDVSAKYNDLDGSIQLVELQRGAAGLGLSLAGNRDRKKMSVFVCGLHPRGSASIDGRIKVGDEILEVNGYALFGRCHLNASAVIKNLDGPVYRILLLRRESALSEMAVKPLTQFPVHLEEEAALEEKYNRFTGVRTVTVRKSPAGLGIMIIEGKHTDLGRGVFISDIQSGSPAEQSGLAVGDMILCVNHTDLICSDYDTAASLLKNAEGLLSVVVAKPNKTCLKASLSQPNPENTASSRRFSSSSTSNNCFRNNNNNSSSERISATATASASFVSKQKSHQHQQNPSPHPSLLLQGTSETRDRLPDEFDGTCEGSQCPGRSYQTRASSSISSSRPSAASLSSSTTSSSTRGGSSRCSSREKEQELDHRSSSRTGLPTKSDFCSISSSQIPLPVIPNLRRGSKDASELDLKSCPIIPGRNSLIEITKKSLGLGLNVIGGSDTPLGVLMIQEVLDNGSAAADGRLKVGDLILRANDHDLRSLNHRQAISLLRQIPSVIQLLIYRDSDDRTDDYDVIVTEVTKKAGRGLGMGIAATGSGVIVSDIVRGGITDSNGLIATGDRILEVNGRDMKSASHEEATNILKTVTGKIELKIGRMKVSPSIRSTLISRIPE